MSDAEVVGGLMEEEELVIDSETEAQVEKEMQELREENKRLQLEVLEYIEKEALAEKAKASKYISWLADRCGNSNDRTFLSMAIERCVVIAGERLG